MSKLNLNAHRWHPENKRGFLFGILGVALAFFIRFSMQPWLATSLPIFFFQINSIIITFYFGIYPGLFTLIISLPIIFYFFSEPLYSFSGVEASDIRIVFVYAAYTLISGIIIELLRRSQYSHRMDALVNQTLYKLILDQSTMKSKKVRTNKK